MMFSSRWRLARLFKATVSKTGRAELCSKALGLGADDTRRLQELQAQLQRASETSMGYPLSGDIHVESLHGFLTLSLNNIGDPYRDGTYRVHTHGIELEVIEFFRELLHADPSDAWGYVTSGGTEGNIYGLFLGRELLGEESVLFHSSQSHYSIDKAARLLRLPRVQVQALPSGAIDCGDLAVQLAGALRSRAALRPLVLANIGSTMLEAVDDVPAIRGALAAAGLLGRAYVHADAALSGMTLPFQAGAPQFDFAAGVDSISVSGHKFIGSPMPCGVILAKKAGVERVARGIEYIGTRDTTLLGSRNGFTPLVLWRAIKAHGRGGFEQRVHECVRNAEYAVQALRAAGVPAWRNPYAITVVFPRPPEAVVAKWAIAVHGDVGHLIAVPHVTTAMIDGLAADLAAAAAASGTGNGGPGPQAEAASSVAT